MARTLYYVALKKDNDVIYITTATKQEIGATYIYNYKAYKVVGYMPFEM